MKLRFSHMLIRKFASSKPAICIGGVEKGLFIKFAERAIPFAKSHLKPEVVVMRNGYVRALIFPQDSFKGLASDCIHTGVLSSFIDHISGFCSWSTQDNAEHFTNTVDLSINFCGKIPFGTVVTDSVCAKITRNYVLIETRCYLLSTASLTEKDRLVLSTVDKHIDLNSMKQNKDGVGLQCPVFPEFQFPFSLVATATGTFNIYKARHGHSTLGFVPYCEK